MAVKEILRPIDFLKSMGFGLDEKPEQLDRMFLKSLAADDRKKLREVWAAREFGSTSSLLDLYRLPKTRKQAALLFSQDWSRANATMKWFDAVVGKLALSSIIEMGCGAGFLLKYIQTRQPHLRLQGIDEAPNLIAVGSEICGRPLIAESYLRADPDNQYDLIACDFGFDLVNFTSSSLPHTTESICEAQFCPSCSDHLKLQFDRYLQSWRRWANEDSYLAITGRLGHFGMVRALVLSAHDVGWDFSPEDSEILKVTHRGMLERFPALLFKPRLASTSSDNLSRAAHFFAAP